MSATDDYRAAVRAVRERGIAFACDAELARLDDAVRALMALGIQRAIGREGDPMTWEPTLAAELLPKE